MLKDLVTSMTMLNGVSQDERQAWERFVKVYKDPMCEFARSQAALHGMSETEAEDAVFTLFERFAQHKERFDPSKDSLRNWLMMRLKNILLDAARQRASEKARADRAMADRTDGDSERQREWKEVQLAIMRRALKVVGGGELDVPKLKFSLAGVEDDQVVVTPEMKIAKRPN